MSYKMKERWTQKQIRRTPFDDGGRDWSHTAQAKKCLELLEAGKAKEGASPKTESQGARLPDILILHS